MPATPTAIAWRDGPNLVVVCPFCHREHRHGVVGPNVGDGDGYRTSDCIGRQRGTYEVREER
ncbi:MULTISPECIES: hypothetical protein [Streptomyces]|uniref:HNH endonuclease n=1 Tax=Streptomyces dengpaensis TaxID=2049881 RepID=A0ABN5I6G0_9ACTN|nr:MULTISPECIES: hypothetical protein [Streptomyces]AVH58673.1 hypothetical protein C4B68_26155 [Streptomyces dengpaensis]PIB11268.1 hypothetical protein B1C81_05485 [Streptomyces sp. HG99]